MNIFARKYDEPEKERAFASQEERQAWKQNRLEAYLTYLVSQGRGVNPETIEEEKARLQRVKEQAEQRLRDEFRLRSRDQQRQYRWMGLPPRREGERRYLRGIYIPLRFRVRNACCNVFVPNKEDSFNLRLCHAIYSVSVTSEDVRQYMTARIRVRRATGQR